MLKLLRHRKTAKKIWIVLAAIIVPAFIFWGSGSLIRSKRDKEFQKTLFGKSVSRSDFIAAIMGARNQALMLFGNTFNEVSDSFNLESMAEERLILLHEARKRKIRATDSEVVSFVQNYPLFHNRKGEFNRQIYEQEVKYTFGTKPRIFEEQIRDNLTIIKLYKDITARIEVTEEEIQREYANQNEQVSINYIAAIPADFKEPIAASEEELLAYFNENPSVFKQPVTFNVEYVALPSSDTQKTVDPLLARIQKGGELRPVAEEFGLAVQETGYFSESEPVPGIGWLPDALNVLVDLTVGQLFLTSDKEQNYLIRLKDKKQPYVPEFSQIKGEVKTSYAESQVKAKAKDKILKAYTDFTQPGDENIDAQDLENKAKELGLKFDSTELFGFGTYLEGIGSSDTFFVKARALKEGKISDVIATPSGFYIIGLKEKLPVDEEKFREEKEAFAENLLARKKQIYFSKVLGDLKRKAYGSSG